MTVCRIKNRWLQVLTSKRRGFRAFPIVVFLLSAGGCAPLSIDQFAATHQMTLSTVRGDGFDHVVVTRFNNRAEDRLHIYIEGDGIPWARNLPSADPTPQNKLALRLASLDTSDIAYVGRPCYFGQAVEESCFPRYWTSHRYGEEVLQSMASAIGKLRQPRHERIVLIGHSGGGALAALLQSRVEGVIGVITVAANLDTDKWTAHHGYDGLTGSLNPMSQSTDARIPHLQLVGGKDDTVPRYTAEDYARRHPNVELIVIEDFDHACCWEEEWPGMLDRFSAMLDRK